MWKCYQYSREEGTWVFRGQIDLPADCFGDELYNHMEEKGWIETIDKYDVKGNSDIVYVTGQEEKDGKFMWEFSRKRNKKIGN